jgi:hypothetical protein
VADVSDSNSTASRSRPAEQPVVRSLMYDPAMGSRSAVLALLAVVGGGCEVSANECVTSADCTGAMRCVDGRCVSRADAGRLDAGHADGGTIRDAGSMPPDAGGGTSDAGAGDARSIDGGTDAGPECVETSAETRSTMGNCGSCGTVLEQRTCVSGSWGPWVAAGCENDFPCYDTCTGGTVCPGEAYYVGDPYSGCFSVIC